MEDIGIGTWILPKPTAKNTYVKIPRLGRTIPFGYAVDDEDEEWLKPIPVELDALEKAKEHLKQYSLRQVAAWLTKVTGREISHMGLSKRIKSEQSVRRRNATYRKLARGYEAALKKAQEFEQRLGTKEEDTYFASDEYRRISARFGEADRDDGNDE
jgi:hypothetical protein